MKMMMVLIFWRLSRSSRLKHERSFEGLTLEKKSKSCAATTAQSSLSKRTGSDHSILLDCLGRSSLRGLDFASCKSPCRAVSKSANVYKITLDSTGESPVH
jgi:hypothetical protein